MANWSKDLKRGQDGEAAILARFPQLKATDGRAHDLVHDNGTLWEIKTDFTKYTNIFLEVISNDTKNSPGGPFQSLFKKVDYYLYRFDKTDSIFCYKVADLAWFLYTNKEKYPVKSISNKGYNTKGFAIPQADLKHLELNLEELLNGVEKV